ncbi:MAG: hypothetical protein J7L15_02520 [Clostridiales bacterium]|nr:hypothetical protein [Clostridiales bacterium]
MINIQFIKKKKEQEFALKYYGKDFGVLSGEESALCSYAAETFSYIDIVIPEGFRKLTISNFQGSHIDSKRQEKIDLLPSNVVVRARNLIAKYCWGHSWDDICERYPLVKDREVYLNTSSAMSIRLKNKNDVIIYGQSGRNPIGRTFCASLIMREAIKLRMKNNGYRHGSYDWVDFAVMIDDLKYEREECVDYRSVEWLVIDNITESPFRTDNMQNFMCNILNPFLLGRQNRGLVTILVFKFNILKGSFDIENFMGVGAYKIFKSKKTLKISLNS